MERREKMERTHPPYSYTNEMRLKAKWRRKRLGDAKGSDVATIYMFVREDAG
jgi:hypothetical protein